MPIYAYRCAACGHSRDVLQKMSDAQLTVCPVCGAEQFQKQVTAAGFQLKGSGWYATDFRGGNSGAPAPAAAAAGTPAAPAAGDASSGGSSSGGGESSSGGGTSASASSSSTACGGSCACH